MKKRYSIPPMWQIILFLSITSIILIPHMEHSHAEKNQFITISISKTCEKLVQLNQTTCPSYQTLLPYDSSIPFLMGEFQTDNGFLHRLPSTFTQPENYFDTEDKWRIIIDPPIDILTVSKNIHITNNFEHFMKYGYLAPNHSITYNNATIDKQIINYTKTNSYTTYSEYYIDKDCRNVYLNALTYFIHLDSLIQILKNGCDGIQPNITNIVSIPHTEIDITTSPYYQSQQRLEYIKENCLTTYGSCKSIPEFN